MLNSCEGASLGSHGTRFVRAQTVAHQGERVSRDQPVRGRSNDETDHESRNGREHGPRGARQCIDGLIPQILGRMIASERLCARQRQDRGIHLELFQYDLHLLGLG
jgi:hypothetical protein